MKKLNITKEQYDKSDYFTKKYGSIKFVSESGKKMYKTDKGVVLTLEGKEVKEDIDDDDTPISVDTDKEEGEVTRTELTEMLTSVADELKKACDSQDIPFEEVVGLESDGEKEDGDEEPFDESEEEDGEEVIATKEDVAEVLGGVIDAVKNVADKAGVELPEKEEDGGDDDGEFEILDEEEEDGKKCPHCGKKCECGNSRTKMMESIRRRRAIRKVRESLKRKAVRGKMLESARRRAKIRKMLESRKAKMERRAKVLESIKRRARHRKMMESRKVASRKVAPKGFRKIKR